MRVSWLVVGAVHRGWVAQRRGWVHQLEELALVLTGESEGIWVGLLLDSKVMPVHLPTSQTNNAPGECHFPPSVGPPVFPSMVVPFVPGPSPGQGGFSSPTGKHLGAYWCEGVARHQRPTLLRGSH